MAELTAGAVAVVLMVIAVTYNQLTRTVRSLRAVWSDVTTELARRHTLAERLVEASRPHTAASELDVVTDAVEAARAAGDPVERVDHEDRLSTALDELLLLMGRYPTLAEDPGFRGLEDELQAVHGRLTSALQGAQRYAREYRKAVRSFPGNLLEASFGLQEHERRALDDPRIAATLDT